MILTDGQKQSMLQAAKMSHPLEACGVIAKDGAVVVFKNIAKQPSLFWAVDPDEVKRFYAKRGAPVAVWHSHPGGTTEPSATDWDHHMADVPMLIVAGDEVYVYEAP